MKSTLFLPRQAVLTLECRTCTEQVDVKFDLRVPTAWEDMGEEAEFLAEQQHEWKDGCCESCSAKSSADQAEVEKADSQRREEAVA